MAFGTGGHFRFIPIHEVAAAVVPRKSANLLLFHALTGCDTVSSFAGIGKKTALAAWNVYPEVTEAFEELMHMSYPINDRTLEVIERFVVLMYSGTSDLSRVNDARKQLFAQKFRSLENIPPTQAALEQHLNRARYQCNCWNISVPRSTVARSFWLGMDEGLHRVAVVLDRSPRGIKVVLRTDTL